MQSASFGNFQVGIIDNPSIEDKGGFEFASGMDIFSEPGVIKANYALQAVSGFTPPTGLGWGFDTVKDGVVVRGYMAVKDKIYTSTDGITWSLFITAGGTIYSLKIFNGYIFYALFSALGRVQVNNAGTQNDAWGVIQGAFWHPQTVQGGTLKVGAGRYVASIDESFTLTAQAMKAPTDYTLVTATNYLNRLLTGSSVGDFGQTDITTESAETFDWRGTVLSSGAALPDTSYHLSKRGMNLLMATGQGLFGFPDRRGEIFTFNGATFVPFRQLSIIANNSDLKIRPQSGCEHFDTVLFTGDSSYFPGIFQIKGGAICQSFVPSAVNPGATEEIDFGFLASGFDGKVFVSYYRPSDLSYHVEYLGSNRQNHARMRTVWHRIGTDKLKRWVGIKPNLKAIPANCSVTVATRTDRKAVFVDSGYTITSANQDKPIILQPGTSPGQPRSREIQFQFEFVTSTTNTPELLSYDVLYQPLKTVRE